MIKYIYIDKDDDAVIMDRGELGTAMKNGTIVPGDILYRIKAKCEVLPGKYNIRRVEEYG